MPPVLFRENCLENLKSASRESCRQNAPDLADDLPVHVDNERIPLTEHAEKGLPHLEVNYVLVVSVLNDSAQLLELGLKH